MLHLIFDSIIGIIHDTSLVGILLTLAVVVFACKIIFRSKLTASALKLIGKCCEVAFVIGTKLAEALVKLIALAYSLVILCMDSKKHNYSAKEYFRKRTLSAKCLKFEHVSGCDEKIITNPIYIQKIVYIYNSIVSIAQKILRVSSETFKDAIHKEVA